MENGRAAPPHALSTSPRLPSHLLPSAAWLLFPLAVGGAPPPRQSFLTLSATKHCPTCQSWFQDALSLPSQGRGRTTGIWGQSLLGLWVRGDFSQGLALPRPPLGTAIHKPGRWFVELVCARQLWASAPGPGANTAPLV